MLVSFLCVVLAAVPATSRSLIQRNPIECERACKIYKPQQEAAKTRFGLLCHRRRKGDGEFKMYHEVGYAAKYGTFSSVVENYFV